MTTKTFFNSEIRQAIKEELTKAQHEIYIAVAWFNDKELFEILLNKAELGLNINLLISNDPANFENPENINFDLLIELGGKISRLITENTLMHNKFCVIDNHTLITGSYNWTYAAHFNNLENIVIIENDIKLCEAFKAEYHRILNEYFSYIQDFDNLLNQFIEKAEELKKKNTEGKLDPNWILKILEKKHSELFLSDGESPNENEIHNDFNKLNVNFSDWWDDLPIQWQKYLNDKLLGSGRISTKPAEDAIMYFMNLEKIECRGYYTWDDQGNIKLFISSLDGVQNFINLKELVCTDNSLTHESLNALNEVNNLVKLDLSINKISAIPLNIKLNKLIEFNITNNQIISLDFLNNMPNLEILYCFYNSKLSGIQGVEKAKKLRLIFMDKRKFEQPFIKPKLIQLGFEKRDYENDNVVKLEREI